MSFNSLGFLVFSYSCDACSMSFLYLVRSVYITFDRLVDNLFGEGKETRTIVNFLDKIAKEKLEPFIENSYTALAKVTNAYEQKMVMAREVIADKGIWTAKKRYILNVHDSEGVRYNEPKLKIMGIEAVKSSTPQVCWASSLDRYPPRPVEIR